MIDLINAVANALTLTLSPAGGGFDREEAGMNIDKSRGGCKMESATESSGKPVGASVKDGVFHLWMS